MGGKCGKPTSKSLSFSITKSVATKHPVIPVDVTSPHIARDCQPMLQLHYRRRSDGWTARYATSMVGCVWEVEGRADARAGGRVSLKSPPISPTMPPLRRRDVRNRSFNFGSVSVLKKNSDSVRNEFGSVRFGLQKLGSVRIVIYY